MEEKINEVVEETIEVVEEKPKYEFHTPKAPDTFTMAKIIGKIGINKFSGLLQKKEIQDLAKEITNKNEINSEDIETITGIGVFIEIGQIILENIDKCESDIYKLLSSTSNLTIDEVINLDGVTFLEMIIDFFKRNVDFIKAASKYVK